MLRNPAIVTTKRISNQLQTRNLPRSTGSVFFVLIYIFRFRCYCSFSPRSILTRHIQQHQQVVPVQQPQYCRVFRSKKLRTFSIMDDSNVLTGSTNRKRSIHNNDEIEDNDDNNVLDTPSSESGGADLKRVKLISTIRNFTTSLPKLDTSISYDQRKDMAIQNIQSYTNAMLERHQQMIPFSNDSEISIIVHSLQNVIPTTTSDNDNNVTAMNTMLHELKNQILPQYAHLSHKNWTMTGENAEKWHSYLFPSSSLSSSSSSSTSLPHHETNTTQLQLFQRHMFERIYREGNWDGAVRHRQQQQQSWKIIDGEAAAKSVKPWAVLVTGVNGIRKTTSIYQEWFPLLLQEAIVSPSSQPESDIDMKSTIELPNLPCGSNTFFRQLDHMIATLCNEEFIRLYTYTRDMLVTDNHDGGTRQQQQPTSDIIQFYSNMKAAIFSRYRTISELLGVILLREAQKIHINCMVETSGRDVAMFHYIDHFFPATTYSKLALHFTINDLQHAKTSVDQRMIDEIQSGIMALDKNSIFDIINTNVGGPYGSEVLSDIQADSDRVWKENVMVDDGGVGQDWYKATIQINAHATEPWTAQAVKPDGSLGTIYHFKRK